MKITPFRDSNRIAIDGNMLVTVTVYAASSSSRRFICVIHRHPFTLLDRLRTLMDKQIKARTRWVNLYLKTKDATFICRKCGIFPPTLRKWYRRYLKVGLQGLVKQSKKPLSSPNLKFNPECIQLILNLRCERNLGHLMSSYFKQTFLDLLRAFNLM